MKAVCKCNKCGASQEQQFSWDGRCLMCEEDDARGDEDDGNWFHDSDMEARG